MSLFNRVSGGRGPSNTSNPGNREVCKFYLEGRCRYGDQCRFYHPPRDQIASQASSQTRSGSLPYHLNPDAIKADLKDGEERPIWPLSAYGPGRDPPRQLLEGALEQSPEELRVEYYLARASGNTQQYEQSERDGYNQSNQQVQRILNDIDGAVKYVIDGKDQHPNRDDMVIKGPPTFPWREKPSNGQITQSATSSAFGQPSALSRGTPFGQSSATTTQQPTAFGQPSTFGSGSAFGGQTQTGGAAFGQSSSLGTQQSSAFGAPSTLGTGGSAFGKPSAFGAAASGGSAFGQASTLDGSSPFGGAVQTAPNTQTPAFGQPSAPTGGSAFGKPSPFGATASSGTSAFGQASVPGQQQSPFGQSQQQPAFGQPSAPTQQSVFGQASAPGQQQSTFGKPSPFGTAAPAASSSPFGQTTAASSQPAFGSASNLGATTGGSTFGAPSAPAQTTNPFGGGAQPTSTSTTSTTPFGSSAPARPAGQGPPTSWKGQPVAKVDGLYFHRNSAGKQERIWFPEGPPGPNPDVEATPQDVYNSEPLGKVLMEIYSYVKQHGTFKDGLVPEIPPKREWVSWEV